MVLLVVLQRGGVWDSLGSSEAAAGMGAGAGAESRARGPSSESKPVGPVSITVSSFKKKPSKRAPAAPILPRTRRAATLRSGLSIATTNIRAIQEKAKYRVIFQLRPPLRSSPVFKLRTDKYTGTTATASKNDPSPQPHALFFRAYASQPIHSRNKECNNQRHTLLLPCESTNLAPVPVELPILWLWRCPRGVFEL